MRLTDTRSFHVRIMGGCRGFLRTLLRIAMMPTAVMYAFVMLVRRLAYQRGILHVHELSVPVISVGNLTVGGTGKTPMIEWIVRWLLQHGRKPALLSRGYGAKSLHETGCHNDEALMLERTLPETLHYADPDRVRSGTRAVAGGADCLLLDDGFQRLRVHRDLDIVLLDAIEKFGNSFTLPAGTLRETPCRLRYADVIVLTRSDQVSETELETFSQRVRRHAPQAILCHATHRPVSATAIDDAQTLPLAELSGRKAGLFCGLGNPQGFLKTAKGLGIEVDAAHFLPDHCAYRPENLERIASGFSESGIELALCTEKDAVKIGDRWPGPMPLWVLRVEIAFTAGQDALEKILEDRLARWHS